MLCPIIFTTLVQVCEFVNFFNVMSAFLHLDLICLCAKKTRIMVSGGDPQLINRVQDPIFLDGIAQTFADVQNTVRDFGPWADAWVSEAGGAYQSGGRDVSHTFANGFWFVLDHHI